MTTLAGLLLSEIEKRRVKNSRYSLRAFARQIGVSPSLLSLIVNNKQPISMKVAKKIAAFADLSPSDIDVLMRAAKRKRTKSSNDAFWKELSASEFALISNWYYYGILALAHYETNDSDPAWIARELGITKSEASEAFGKLMDQGVIAVKSHGFRQIGEMLTTSHHVPSMAIRKHHRQNLARAEMAMDHLDVTERYLTSATFAMSPGDYKKICDELDKFRRRVLVMAKASKGEKRVYTLGMQLFPCMTQH